MLDWPRPWLTTISVAHDPTLPRTRHGLGWSRYVLITIWVDLRAGHGPGSPERYFNYLLFQKRKDNRSALTVFLGFPCSNVRKSQRQTFAFSWQLNGVNSWDALSFLALFTSYHKTPQSAFMPHTLFILMYFCYEHFLEDLI